jgi:hypothetical protein
MIKIATCLLALSLLAACQTTSATAQRQTAPHQNLQQRRMAQTATANPNGVAQPAPPAEGPEDVPATGTVDPNRNPGLLPTPLLRGSAAGSL